MRLLHFSAALFLLLLNVTDAKVEFTYSTMYNIFDFEGSEEIPLHRCDFGCLIFASTYVKDSDHGMDPYNKNLIVYDQAKNRNRSISDIGLQYEEGTLKKIPFDIAANGHYVIRNLNALEDKGNDVTVWVIERAKASEFDYEIYDAANLNRPQRVPSTIITVMSALQFRVLMKAGEPKSYTARLVGFDNALDDNPDNCNYAFKNPYKDYDFQGFTFHVNAPIISIVFNERKTAISNLNADYYYINSRDLGKSGFISSPGYNGCAKLGNNQVHLAKQYHYSEDYDFHGEPEAFRIDYDADVSLTYGHEVTIKDMTNNKRYSLTGDQNYHITITTETVIISYDDLAPPQSFILRFSSILPGTEPATLPSIDQTTHGLTTTSPKFVSPTTSITSTTYTPTTSSAEGVAGIIAIACPLLWLLH